MDTTTDIYTNVEIYLGEGIPFVKQEFLQKFLPEFSPDTLKDAEIIKEMKRKIEEKYDEKEFHFVSVTSENNCEECKKCSPPSSVIFLGKLKKISIEEVQSLISSPEKTSFEEIPLLTKLGYEKEKYITLLFSQGKNTVILN